jgi:hypothetical protein
MVTLLPDLRSNRTRPCSTPSTVAIDQDCRAASNNMRAPPQFEPLLEKGLCMDVWHGKGRANRNGRCGSVK